MKSRKSVLILQGEVVAYRQPLFNALADYYDVTVLHSGRPSVGPADRYAERILPVKRLGPFFIQDPLVVRQIMTGFDVTISMFDLGWPAYVLPVLGERSGRIVFHGHRYSGKWLTDLARDFLMKRADCLLMYGDEEVVTMVRRGIDRSKIVIAPNTIHVANHQDFSGHEKTRFLFVGRLQDRKRLDLALEAFAGLQGQIGERIGFDIVGTGDPEQRLRALVERLGVTAKVRFHGRIVDDATLSEVFANAIAYVSPGPVGLGVLHSFAYGVPVVTLLAGRHGPEFHNLVDGRNAIIANDERDLARALLSLCSESGLARRLGRNAYQRYVNSRTLQHMVAGFRDAIEGTPGLADW
jgi:glycosyltransferase involved in cell wall biosynthesis